MKKRLTDFSHHSPPIITDDSHEIDLPPIYKRFAIPLEISNGKYLVSPSVSSRVSLEYKLQNGWIERLARRGWPKFSTAGKPGSCGTADVAWLWERKRALAMPRATRSSRIGTASSDGKKKRKEKALSLYIYIQIRASNEIYLASLLAMEHLSTTLFTLFTLPSNEFYPFDERIQTEPSPPVNRFAVRLRWDRLCLSRSSYLVRLEC